MQKHENNKQKMKNLYPKAVYLKKYEKDKIR